MMRNLTLYIADANGEELEFDVESEILTDQDGNLSTADTGIILCNRQTYSVATQHIIDNHIFENYHQIDHDFYLAYCKYHDIKPTQFYKPITPKQS